MDLCFSDPSAWASARTCALLNAAISERTAFELRIIFKPHDYHVFLFDYPHNFHFHSYFERGSKYRGESLG